ncbi:MAG: hypothetical protein LUD72_01160 [Bacteroidales bacterium]|nr:hypothetical protein [Bacteroidales bacterium]
MEKEDEEKMAAGKKPARKENRVRKKGLYVMLTQAEYEKVAKKAEAAKLTKREFVTRVLLEKDIYVIECGHELVYQLTRLANNYNQTIKNVYLETASREELVYAKDLCTDFIEEIHEKFSGGGARADT